MWRDSTPLFLTRSRLHQLPVTVFSSSGRNHTSGACGTHTRSSSGIGLHGDLGLDAGELDDHGSNPCCHVIR